MSQWTGCYDSSWRGLIVDAAFAHPAKIAHGLAFKIYDHAIKEGWLRPGDTVLDPFGGICGTALHAATSGMKWIGVELEPKFVGLGRENIALWKREFGRWPEWVEPVLLQGDSRRLCELVGGAECVVSSPPFSGSEQPCASQGKEIKDYHAFTRGRGTKRDPVMTGGTDGQLGAMPEGNVDCVLSSPPYAECVKGPHGETETAQESRDKRRTQGGSLGQSQRHGGYGVQEGQLGAMKEGDVAAIVSSPPYAETFQSKDNKPSGLKVEPERMGRCLKEANANGYGQTPGQLGGLKEGRIEAVVSSPPFEDKRAAEQEYDTKYKRFGDRKTSGGRLGRSSDASYGESSDNLGNSTGDTFWSAAAEIVRACYTLLRPGGHAIWVVKAYVKNKQIVDFPGNWQRLCESVGFKTVCVHRAMLVKDLGHETNLFEPPKRKVKERKSFFRRLAEKKGSPRIDYEVVLCMVKETNMTKSERAAYDEYGRSLEVSSVEMVMSSPPYAETFTGKDDKPSGLKVEPERMGRSLKRMNSDGFSTTPGQLGSMKEGKQP